MNFKKMFTMKDIFRFHVKWNTATTSTHTVRSPSEGSSTHQKHNKQNAQTGIRQDPESY
jgi:hypothetical protein